VRHVEEFATAFRRSVGSGFSRIDGRFVSEAGNVAVQSRQQRNPATAGSHTRAGSGRTTALCTSPVFLHLFSAAVAVALAVPAFAQTKAPASGPPAAKPPSARRAAAPAANSAAFDAALKAATEARQAENWEEAANLYAQVVKLKPDYIEGHWYRGTALYQLDRFAECRDAFKRTTRLAPKNGAAFAFLGLCEFGLKEYDRALSDLLQSRLLGVGDTGDLGSVARYHAAILMTRVMQYEQALETLGEFASEGNDNPRVIEAMGIATMRMAMLPSEVPPDRREMVLMAGRASYLMATRMPAAAGKAFEALVTRYPDTPNAHYAYGVFLIQEQPDKGLEEFKRELEIQPSHPWSLMQLAYEYLKRGEPQTALPYAKEAVQGAPNAFPARKALGQALLDTGDIAGAVEQLEAGVKLAPDSPGLRFVLARAYQRAGRPADAERERETFNKLDRYARTQRAGAQSVGGIDTQRVSEPPGGGSPQ